MLRTLNSNISKVKARGVFSITFLKSLFVSRQVHTRQILLQVFFQLDRNGQKYTHVSMKNYWYFVKRNRTTTQSLVSKRETSSLPSLSSFVPKMFQHRAASGKPRIILLSKKFFSTIVSKIEVSSSDPLNFSVQFFIRHFIGPWRVKRQKFKI